MPEEIKGLLRVIATEQQETRKTVDDLDRDVKKLAESQQVMRSANRRLRWWQAAFAAVLATAIVLALTYVLDAFDRRAEFRRQLHDLACLAVRRTPPGLSDTADDLRQRYACPPYHAAPAATPVPKGTTATRTTTASSTVTATATVSATGTATIRPSASTVTVPGPTRTVVTRRTVSSVATRTVTASPSRCLLVLPC